MTKIKTLTNIFIEKEVFKIEKEASKKEEEMPKEAKLLLEMVQKAGTKGVTREEMRNTPLGDLFKNPNGFNWLSAQEKIECHVCINGNDPINTWFLWKKIEGEEPPEYFKQVSSTSGKQ